MPQYTIFKNLNLQTDKFTNTNKLTVGLFNNGAGTLNASSMATASVSASNKSYFYTVTQDSGTVGVKYFDLSYGHVDNNGASSTDNLNVTKAIYKQYANIILDDPLKKFTFTDVSGSDSGTERDDIYILNIKSAKMKDRAHTKWTLTLSGSDAAGAGSTLHLTNYTASRQSSIAGDFYDVISGSAGVPGTSVASTTYGHFYPSIGVIVLSATKLSASLPGTPGYINSGSNAGYYTGVGQGFAVDSRTDGNADNAGKFADILLNNASSIVMRSEQDLNQSTYYCRLFNQEFNFTSNPTFLKSGSALGDIRSDQVGDPTVYLSGIGLYNDFNELIAIAKLNQPVKKNFSNEANIVVKIDG